MLIRLLSAVPVIVLGACGSPSTYPPALIPQVAFTMTETALTFVGSDGTTTTLLRDDTYDYGAFVGALQTGEGEGGMISMYRSQDASASVVVTFGDETLNYTTVYERLDHSDRPTFGTATYQGEFISAYVANSTTTTEASSAPSQVRSDLEMVVDFRRQTIEGEITNRTAYLLGLPHLFELDDALQIDLMPTDLSATGNFAGQAVYVGDGTTAGLTGSYEGLIAGNGGSEVVGAITIGDETGVFAGVAE